MDFDSALSIERRENQVLFWLSKIFCKGDRAHKRVVFLMLWGGYQSGSIDGSAEGGGAVGIFSLS